MLIDLPPVELEIFISSIMHAPVTGAVVVSTPQAVALADAKKRVSMFLSEAINVPVLGIIENMAYFTPESLLITNIIFSVKKEPKLSRRFRCASLAKFQLCNPFVKQVIMVVRSIAVRFSSS
jgi:Mrp family chromosome partitioning ATPase